MNFKAAIEYATDHNCIVSDLYGTKSYCKDKYFVIRHAAGYRIKVIAHRGGKGRCWRLMFGGEYITDEVFTVGNAVRYAIDFLLNHIKHIK